MTKPKILKEPPCVKISPECGVGKKWYSEVTGNSVLLWEVECDKLWCKNLTGLSDRVKVLNANYMKLQRILWKNLTGSIK